MDRLFINESTLVAIGDAIREKNGSVQKYKPSAMPDAIRNLFSVAEITITQPTHARGMFAGSGFDDSIIGNLQLLSAVSFKGEGCITKSDTSDSVTFQQNQTTIIPFDVVFASGNGPDTSFFEGCDNLTQLPVMRTIDGTPLICGDSTTGSYNSQKHTMNRTFYYCKGLTEIPLKDWIWGNNSMYQTFMECQKLKKLEFYDFVKRYYDGTVTDAARMCFYETFRDCDSMLEITDLPFPDDKTDTFYTKNSRTNSSNKNIFISTFGTCLRLRKLTFFPGIVVTNLTHSPTIDLSKVGYGDGYNCYDNNNVSSNATYQALKNTDDWWSKDYNYSQYNHDSAVETINSLPTITGGSGVATIKFKGDAGSLTDGGAINTLTEEEIAVATAKGWTVTLTT